jgi:hypothetical protein
VFEPETDKCVLVLADGLDSGVAANVAAVLGVTLGARLPLVGPDSPDASGEPHLGLTKATIPLLSAPPERLPELRRRARAKGLGVADFTEAAQRRTYPEYQRELAAAPTDEHRYLGLALYGPKRDVNSVSGSLRLFR